MKRLFAVAAVAVSLSAGAREIAGVTLGETVSVDGKTLTLNGAGLRKKAIFKVYVGALYLETPSHDGAAILASDQAMRVEEVFVRSVDKSKVTETYNDEFKKNAGAAFEKFRPRIDKFTAALSDVKDGDKVALTYLPGKGTTLTLNGASAVTIEGKDFAQLLFGLWLGSSPGDRPLSDAMLGK